jgi:AbiV family abortive infection protein
MNRLNLKTSSALGSSDQTSDFTTSRRDRRFEQAIRACLENGRRLLDDVESLQLNNSAATAYFLVMIAQEEFAKGFLLALVLRRVIPWDAYLFRATRDHTCKQLLCLIMEYLWPEDEEFKARCDAVILHHERPRFPAKVADAINILRHEKIGRWRSRNWGWAEDPEYNPEALAIAEGKLDRLKQDALYVRLGSDGGLAAMPSQYRDKLVEIEIDRAQRFATLVKNLLVAPIPGLDYDTVEETFRILFAPQQTPE